MTQKPVLRVEVGACRFAQQTSKAKINKVSSKWNIPQCEGGGAPLYWLASLAGKEVMPCSAFARAWRFEKETNRAYRCLWRWGDTAA